MLRALHGELIARHAAGRQVVLLAEEAQAMPGATLEALRLLTNLETASHKLLQIVLFGQPELQHTLDLPQFRQLKERITHSFTVPRLPQALLNDYLACRLAAAGRMAPLVFTPAALRRLARAAQGIVRRVNILADKALLAAFADDAQQISARHMRLAIADSPFHRPPWHAGKLVAGSLSALMLLLAAALLWQWLAPGKTAAIPAPAAVPRAPLPVPSTLLDSKLAESRDWLARQGPQQLVLHIASLPATETAAAEAFLQQAQQAIGLRDLHVFRLPGAASASAAGRLDIVYGSFADRTSAEAVWARLAPASPQKILLYDIDSIRAEMKATTPAQTGRGAP
ncbi:putative secretion ATPase, PEP-CTERM locus subfamily [Janthinobacterium lividum]|nr:putative secretion ATPase, PEP-CTERM locus subfamily [Janthinobacterium lividum]